MKSIRYPSPVGELLLIEDEDRLTGLWFPGRGPKEVPQKALPGTCPVLDQARRWLDDYFAGKTPAIQELPLHPQGTDFQRTIWKLLEQIPYGTTVTYRELAVRAAQILGHPTGARAVGGAVGRNPISIILPCHRVVGTGGSLTGFGGGIPAKIWLLNHEGVDAGRFRQPKEN